MLTHLSLFSGIGGIDLAAEWAGFTTVGQCEFADYPTKVLEKHWPDVPRWRDVRDVTRNSFRERTGLRTVTLVSGGIPCQPFSVAGKQKGKGDDRYLWPEMLRIVRELAPRWVLVENVPGILRIAADDICKDLEREGYDVGIFDYEAAAVGAPHRRERVFFVGNAKRGGLPGEPWRRSGQKPTDGYLELEKRVASNAYGYCSDTWRSESAGQQRETGIANGGNDVADTYSERESQQERRIKEIGRRIGNGGEDVAYSDSPKPHRRVEHGNTSRFTGFANGDRRTTESGLGGMADGLPSRLDANIAWPPEPDIPRIAKGLKNRVDRLKCLGNAVVPQQVYPILRAIADIEAGFCTGVLQANK